MSAPHLLVEGVNADINGLLVLFCVQLVLPELFRNGQQARHAGVPLDGLNALDKVPLCPALHMQEDPKHEFHIQLSTNDPFPILLQKQHCCLPLIPLANQFYPAPTFQAC